MTRRVFLHIGAPKSGTTYLQDRLAINREVVAANGISYLPTRTGDHFEPALDLIQERWAGQIEVARGQWPVLVNEARRTSGDVLVSHEILAAAKPDQVARALGSFPDDEIHIVYTARDLARQIPAEWQENIKHRGRRTFAKFLADTIEAPRTNPAAWFWRVQGLPDVLTRWSNGLPPDQVHVVTVPPKGAATNALWDRFQSVLGLPAGLDLADSEALNTSIGIVEATLVRRLNVRLHRLKVPRDVYVPMVRELIVRDTFSKRENMVPATLPASSHDFVDQVTGEWLDWIRGSGIDVIGDLSDLEPAWPEHDEDWAHPDRPGAVKLVDAALDALTAVIAGRAQPPPRAAVHRIKRKLLGS